MLHQEIGSGRGRSGHCAGPGGLEQGVITGALLMDVAAAFPSMARECLLRKMREARIDGYLVRQMDSFMQERRVIMSLDGQDGRRW